MVVFGVAVGVVTISTAVILVDVVSVVVLAVVVAEGVVTSPPQLSGSLSSGGLLGPDLHPWQGVLSGEQEEWRMQALGDDE